jgi:ubiquinone/menaquinone biosynthesis C-methylase UbiE
MPADWQLPPGVTRSMWDYLHDPAVAERYDTLLEGTPLLDVDRRFVLEHLKPPGRCIDLGCGTGRLAIDLAQRGFSVVAVDLSAEMLRVAAAKAREAGACVRWIQANLVALDALADRSFDGAACLFSTLGMIAGANERRRVLAHAYRLLRPGGVFILHVHNRWFNIWTRAGRRLLCRDLVNSLTGRAAPGDYDMPPHQGLGSLRMHLFTRGEIARLLIQAGFTLREIRPVSLRADGKLRAPWWLPGLRSYGYLIAAQRR